MKNLLIRALTGLVFIGVTLGCLLYNQYTYILLFLLFLTGGMIEFFRFFNQTLINPSRIMSISSGILIYLVFVLIESGILPDKYYFLLVPLILVFFILELYRHSEQSYENIATSILSLIYVAFPFSMTSLIVYTDQQVYDPSLLIALFAIIWIYDSGAYLFGITLGKHRLFERISPKKSWEGAIGGAISAITASWVIANYLPQIAWIHWIIIALLTVVFSTFGDLTESLFKRQFQLKDSSSIFPGHGGILDRFDSLLFAVPVLSLYIKLIL